MSAFSGDSFLEAEVKRLVLSNGVIDSIETGTDLGATATSLSWITSRCFSLESDYDKYLNALSLISVSRVRPLFGDSPKLLPRLLPHVTHPVLLYLDAHNWALQSCCLREEMQALAEFYATRSSKPVIVIHDCKVPGRDDLGYDTYGDYCIELPLIHPYLDLVYGDWKWSYHYNDKAEGALRGVLFVEPIHE